MGTVGCYPQTLNQFVHHNKQYHVKVLGFSSTDFKVKTTLIDMKVD